VPFALGHRGAILDAWLIDRRWSGALHAREGQPLRWLSNSSLPDLDWLVPDRPLASALRLSRYLAITPDVREPGKVLAAAETAVAKGAGLLMLRLPQMDRGQLQATATAVLSLCRPAGVQVLAHGDWTLVDWLGLDGVHLPSRQLCELRARPVPAAKLLTAACHDLRELIAAVRLGSDAVLVSPVAPTPSHPGVPTIGWPGFAALAARSPLPAYALGGVGPAQLDRVRESGGFGVAGIRAFAR
jgi:8-oxo-dGTP diphosphatase